MLPWNHYSRKVLGYLEAARRGAEIIYDTDDDNAPKPEWGVAPFEGSFEKTAEDLGFVNACRWFTDQHIWPRGFPLRSIRDPGCIPRRGQTPPTATSVGVWQSLTDEDPDVDALYRLVIGTPCRFREGERMVLARGTLCPCNSQATAFRKSCFPLLFLPSGVTSRVTDILRGLVAQPVLWAAGLHLGFTSASVVQDRNPHDLLRDLEDEIPLYRHTKTIVEVVARAVRAGASMEHNLASAYQALAGAGLVDSDEPSRVDAWLEDLAAVS